MNAAVRAVTRLAIKEGWSVFGIRWGYKGLVEGGSGIFPLRWSDVGGVLHAGGTFLGTARSKEFRTPEGRRKAVRHLVQLGIDQLVVVGGDGSLTGAQILFDEWPNWLRSLREEGAITAEQAAAHPRLGVVGLPGSIDNDLPGTDVSIGADTALHRIVEACDRISSTAASHNRIFVLEVMGRRCGYLALMAALATGAEAALVPERPLQENWRDWLCERVALSRAAGRTSSIVLVAEGARDFEGKPIVASDLQKLMEERLHEEVRVTILGHIQRGGAPSAFDRNLATVLGARAVHALQQKQPPVLVGLVGNQAVETDLNQCLEQARAAVEAVDQRDVERAIALRGSHFAEAVRARHILSRSQPPANTPPGHRIAIMHAGAPAPGMNMAARVAVRVLLNEGHTVLGVRRGLRGLVEGDITPLQWMDVSGWAVRGGAELGTSRRLLSGHDLYTVARNFEAHQIQGVLVVGGSAAYETAALLQHHAPNYPSFAIPIVCVPASIDNNLPGSEFAVGADTALNIIVQMVDSIKKSAVASQRCFVVEVMGRDSGYLALLSALATGAEKAYIPEAGISIETLLEDLKQLSQGFAKGRRVGLVIRNEQANPFYTTDFIASLFEEEGHDLFDVRKAILGHVQQGGDPTPFDRTLSVRLTERACGRLVEMISQGQAQSLGVGLLRGQIKFTELQERMPPTTTPWWFGLRAVHAGLSGIDTGATPI